MNGGWDTIIKGGLTTAVIGLVSLVYMRGQIITSLEEKVGQIEVKIADRYTKTNATEDRREIDQKLKEKFDELDELHDEYHELDKKLAVWIAKQDAKAP